MKVAILGCGVVGSGVARLIQNSSQRLYKRFGFQVELKWILDRKSLSGTPLFSFQADSFEAILYDEEIEVVVETIGGISSAYEYTKLALSAGKHVITSNKELVSTHGPELLRLACEKGCYYLYEAAVGGGIPLLRSLREDLAANDITQIAGILNGTSNFILQEMEECDMDFNEAIIRAKHLGYAEQDPSDDIMGKDTARKLAIICSRLFGEYLDPEHIATSGIERISHEEIRFAKRRHAKIKLLALMQTDANGGRRVMTAPYLVPDKHPLSMVNGVYNALMLEGSEVGDCLYYGRGAGSEPTASSILSDMMQIATAPYRKEISELWTQENKNFYLPSNGQKVQAFLFPKTREATKLVTNPDILASLRAFTSPVSEEDVLHIGFTGRLTEAELSAVLIDAGISDQVGLIRYIAKWDQMK